ncbi:IS481 family transposase [Wolbachia endosymbiont (group A) of Cydia splendana]|uniref:IS481 family transposase n=1 Tax=Wolbachia endosymbiont (group A) of Cydia splendana TaxID=2954000 RepID=UPI0021F9022E|nr:IS481 family transposase [Wolbachia endosymbiont (group A) of Cydia splendana]
MDTKVKLRLNWIELYKKLGHAGKVCQHYNISRFTLRKWYKRYEKLGAQGLSNLSSRPKTLPLQKINESNEQLILHLRKARKLGARRIQAELKRLHDISFALATIHKVLKKHDISLLRIKRHYRKQIKRYNCKVPGERVQMDVCKISSGLYQYTAIDDCTRYKVIALYSRRTSKNTLDFLKQLRERAPFHCQRIQTDRGQEFFAYEVQECLKEWKIKFRPIRPFSPHLNGKVERAQRTDLDEFYSSVNIKDHELQVKLRDWEEYYNKQRPHSSLQGKTPWEKYKELEKTIPCLSEIQKNYISSKETFVMQNYKHDQELKSLQKYKTS